MNIRDMMLDTCTKPYVCADTHFIIGAAYALCLYVLDNCYIKYNRLDSVVPVPIKANTHEEISADPNEMNLLPQML